MQDFLKTLIEHLLGWPIATLILVLIFRKPLTSLIDRIDLFKGPAGIEVSTPIDSAAKQLKAEGTSKSGELTSAIPPQQRLPLPQEKEDQRKTVEAYGGNEEIVVTQMKVIEEHLTYLQYSLNSEETVRLLIRQLAVTQLLHKAELLYRLIFGSQIALMRELNESGPQPEATVRQFFERAKAEFPKFYGDYTFEDWFSYKSADRRI